MGRFFDTIIDIAGLILCLLCRRLNLRKTEREREPDPFWEQLDDSPRKKRRPLVKSGRGSKEIDSTKKRRFGGWGEAEEHMSDEEVQFLRRRQVGVAQNSSISLKSQIFGGTSIMFKQSCIEI